MCGIAGFCNRTQNWKSEIKAMCDRMQHRGPDAEGFWKEDMGNIVLGHRRLSILDLSENGAQPMISSSGRFAIAFNGEIYNFSELKKSLTTNNSTICFHGTSDTEILLESFEHVGIEETLKLIKGMFAVALYDREEKKLYLMRDRVGEKPLYYGWVNGTFAFASDIACLYQLKDFQNEVNRDVLNLYFEHGYIPAPYSIFENIWKLEPGTVLSMEEPFQKYEIHQYWSMMDIAKQGQHNLYAGSYEEAKEELDRLLKESIKGQMIADVPVGAFLSGGIDSTTTVAIMQSLCNNKIKTFTIGFEEAAYNEAQEAKKIARHLGTEHTELYVTQKDAEEVIPKIPNIFGEPFADSSQIPTYLVSKLAKQQVTVSLSGDGGDELFCGYNSYRFISEYYNKIKWIPYSVRKMGYATLNSKLFQNTKLQQKSRLLLSQSPENFYERLMQDKMLEDLVINSQRPSFKYSEYPSSYLNGIENNIMLMDLLMYHPDDILVKVDRSAMAVSLESRVPLLDRDVVEFAWNLPLEFKYKDGIQKRILKDVLYQYVPKEMMDRPKSGFSIPISKWIREGNLRDWAEELLDYNTIKKQGYLNSDVVCQMWNIFLETGRYSEKIWYILVFQMWIKSNINDNVC
jgi:asparagine synthase (glutamine-hydrolyzing)